MRKFFTVLTLLMLISLFSSAVSADDVLALASAGYEGDEQSVFAPDGDDVLSVGIPGSDWAFSGDVDWQRRRIEGSISYMTAYLLSDEDFISVEDPSSPDASDAAGLRPFQGYTTLALSYTGRGIDLSSYSTLCFGFSLDAAEGAVYPVSVTLTADGVMYSASLSVTCSSSRPWQLLSVDIRDVRGELESIIIRADYERGSVPASVKCSAPFARLHAGTSFTNADKFATDRFSSAVGSVTPSSGKVRPDEDNRAEISGRLLVTAKPVPGSFAYFIVTLSGFRSGGLTLGVSYEGGGGPDDDAGGIDPVFYTPKAALTSSDSVYVFPVEVSGGMASYTLLFDNIDCDVYFTIDSVSLISGQASPVSGNPNIGTVSSIALSGNSVTFSGSMERDAVRAGGYIYFYALPASSMDDVSAALVLGSTKVSTVFTYTADLSSMPALGDTFLFFAAVHGSGEDGQAVILPLSAPRYADASALRSANVSSAGLAGAASVGAFESNVSHVIVDVPLDELLVSSGGISCSYTNYDADGAEQLRLSRDFLTELDRDINFYVSAGIRVYLRLYSSSPIDGFTYGGDAESYLPDLSEDGVRYRYAALIRFLSSRYSGAAGFVLGHGVNCGEYTGAGTGDLSGGGLSAYVSSLAELCRVTYNAARASVSGPEEDVPVIVPFVPDRGETGWLSPRVLSVMLSERLSEIGTIPWVMQTAIYDGGTAAGSSSDGSAGSAAAADALAALASLQKMSDDLKIPGASALTFLYQPDNDALLRGYGEYVEAARALGQDIPEYSRYAADRFEEIYALCSSFRAYAVFISLDGLSLRNDHAFYSDLKSVGSVSDMDDRYVYESRASVGQAISGNSFMLFDFSDAYHALGWIPGSGVQSCLTEASDRFITGDTPYARVLRSSFAEDMGAVDNTGASVAGAAGIVLRHLDRRYDFSAVDRMEFTLSLEYADGSGHAGVQPGPGGGVTVVLVIGTDDCRAEYYASGLSVGEIQVLSCDLTGYEYRSVVDYIGIMVYADEDIVLDLSSVKLGSGTLSSDALRAMFQQSDEGTVSLDWITAGLFLVLVTTVTVILMIIMTRRDREEDELREAQMLSRHRRKNT